MAQAPAFSNDDNPAFNVAEPAFSPRTKLAAIQAKRNAIDPKANPLLEYANNLKASSAYQSGTPQ